jgi:hypothetical protein
LAEVPDELEPYLKEQLLSILVDGVMHEAILGNLSYETHEERFQRIIECIKQIVSEI